MSLFKGAGVALITPMNEDGSINFSKLEEIIEEQIEGGTDAIIICGTTGEASTLLNEEHLEAIKKAVDIVNGRIPVIAGTGSNFTEQACMMSKRAEALGVDGLLLVTPYYNKCTQRGLKVHYKKIAESVSIPCILYNVPSRTGVKIEPETMKWLYDNVENIVGVKEASGDFSAIAKLMSMVDDDFELYSGNDDQIVPLLSLGGSGVISVLSNVAPRQTHEICEDFFNGDVKSAAEKQLKAINLINALFIEVNPIPVKAALNIMGKEVGVLRLPLYEISDENRQILERELKNYGLL